MFERSNWVLLLIPKNTRESIRKVADLENKKLWQVVAEAVEMYSKR